MRANIWVGFRSIFIFLRRALATCAGKQQRSGHIQKALRPWFQRAFKESLGGGFLSCGYISGSSLWGIALCHSVIRKSASPGDVVVLLSCFSMAAAYPIAYRRNLLSYRRKVVAMLRVTRAIEVVEYQLQGPAGQGLDSVMIAMTQAWQIRQDISLYLCGRRAHLLCSLTLLVQVQAALTAYTERLVLLRGRSVGKRPTRLFGEPPWVGSAASRVPWFPHAFDAILVQDVDEGQLLWCPLALGDVYFASAQLLCFIACFGNCYIPISEAPSFLEVI